MCNQSLQSVLNYMKMIHPKISILIVTLLLSMGGVAQTKSFTHADSLRGSITPERAWWDLSYYHLFINVNTDSKTIEGTNTIRYRVNKESQTMQIDLQEPLKIASATQGGKKLQVRRDGAAHFIRLEKKQVEGTYEEIEIAYGGKPVEAERPPWVGGITWETDANGNPFVASSCQGIGASIWWPCKDHPADEVDSMLISVTVPEKLMNISNGRLRKVDSNTDKTKTYHWFVRNPINAYGVNINIGDYVNFSEKYEGENGLLDMDYYVLRDNLKKAKTQFKDAKRTMEAFEHWFGPYPFYDDSYKLVEAPYLGMEHQSSVTYGNGYQNGYQGRDLSDTGWGLKFDFIIVHESGHEWFANNITHKDIADMWIHESFTNYSESLFLEYHFGKEAGQEYVRGTRAGINNNAPIIGTYNLNQRGSGDMYPKGGNLLNTLRQILDNDDKWRAILRGLNKDFYHQNVTTADIEGYIAKAFGMDLSKVFDQYLRDTDVPILEYFYPDNQTLKFRWTNCIEGFNMPIDILLNGEKQRVSPSTSWNTLNADLSNGITVDPNYYISTFNLR